MSIRRLPTLLAALVLVLVADPLAAIARPSFMGMHPSALEITMLPKYCWGQYYPRRFKGPEFHTPRICGTWMNHLCPGLVALNRANQSMGNAYLRRGYLGGAEEHMKYTLEHMKHPRSCPLRSEVQSTYRLIQLELREAR